MIPAAAVTGAAFPVVLVEVTLPAADTEVSFGVRVFGKGGNEDDGPDVSMGTADSAPLAPVVALALALALTSASDW